MEIIHIAPGGDYARYEELILQKEELEKDAESYYISYIKEFGELTVKAFELKIDCIALKKELSLYVAAKNKGKVVTEKEVETLVKEQMTAYKEELDHMLKEKEEAKKAKPISKSEAKEVKKTYHRLAKILHPDMSPLTGKYPRLNELFNRVSIANKCNDLKELQKLEVLVKSELEKNDINNFNVVIPNISERISELEQDINRIVTSEPYTYKKILCDEATIEKKKDEINAEIEEYSNYKKELCECLKEIKEENQNDR